MKFVICTPLGSVLQTDIVKVTLETLDGYHTFLPRHVDYVSTMGPNIITYTTTNNEQKYAACHHGIVVKKGDEVTVTAQNAVLGDSLDELEDVINYEFKQTEEQRKELNTAMARLELGLVRGFGRLNRESSDG